MSVTIVRVIALRFNMLSQKVKRKICYTDLKQHLEDAQKERDAYLAAIKTV